MSKFFNFLFFIHFFFLLGAHAFSQAVDTPVLSINFTGKVYTPTKCIFTQLNGSAVSFGDVNAKATNEELIQLTKKFFFSYACTGDMTQLTSIKLKIVAPKLISLPINTTSIDALGTELAGLGIYFNLYAPKYYGTMNVNALAPVNDTRFGTMPSSGNFNLAATLRSATDGTISEGNIQAAAAILITYQ